MVERLPAHMLLVAGVIFIGAMALLGTSIAGIFVG